MLACACDGKTFFVKKFLDAQNAFYILVTVHPLPSTAFNRLELGKFRFPEAQNIGGQAAEAGDFAYAKVKFLWNHHIGGAGGLGDGSGAQAHRGFWKLRQSGKNRISPPEFLARPGFWHNHDFQIGAFWGKDEIGGKKPLDRCFSREAVGTYKVRASNVSLTVSVSFSSLPFSLLA
jgi:hypothetical protein